MLLLLLLAAVCVLAFDPHPPPAVDTGWDKRNHALAFAVLALVAELGFWRLPWRRSGIVLGLLAYGGFIELVQARIPGRSGDVQDLLADGVGIAIGLGISWAAAGAARFRSSARRPPGTRSP